MASDVDITKIPGFMRAKGWFNGARLMERWFSSVANDRPAGGSPDTTTISMAKWVLTFQRAQLVYNEIVGQRIWSNDKARLQIAKELKRQGLFGAKKVRFGNLGRRVPEIDREYVNYRVVGSIWDSLDDMFAALGRFTMRVAVEGHVEPVIPPQSGRDGGAAPDAGTPPPPKEWTVTVEQAGIYCTDSYDFNGEQSLGYWDFKSGEVGKTRLSGEEVTNKHFRDWRQQNHRGGDFLVFSDLSIPPNQTPFSFKTS